MERKILKTVADWKAFLRDLPDEHDVFIDLWQVNNGSFEFAVVQERDDEGRCVVVVPTRHCE